ncbi:MAG: hypothetical protein ACJA2S_002990 [Cyclobacteriaceae bacterium]|jgi:hypothetical protein
MRVKCTLSILFSLTIVFCYAQNDKSSAFKAVQGLKRHKGLQDPFLKTNGERVKSKAEWQNQRKYLLSMLEYYQYGQMPPTPTDVIVKETLSEDIYEDKAERKLYTLTIKRNGRSMNLHFGLIKPKGNGPFPVIIKNDPKINDISDEINLDALRRGYIMCQYVRTDLGTDSGDLKKDRSNGVFPLYPEYSWGTITAWAWGYKLLIDFFETQEFIDTNRVVVTGHSRGGKTAFCGGIFDERIAITAPNSSGLGGTASTDILNWEWMIKLLQTAVLIRFIGGLQNILSL